MLHGQDPGAVRLPASKAELYAAEESTATAEKGGLQQPSPAEKGGKADWAEKAKIAEATDWAQKPTAAEKGGKAEVAADWAEKANTEKAKEMELADWVERLHAAAVAERPVQPKQAEQPVRWLAKEMPVVQQVRSALHKCLIVCFKCIPLILCAGLQRRCLLYR